MKFATYKSRLIGRGRSEKEAILEAASKVGVKVADLTGLGVISHPSLITGVDNSHVSVMSNTDNSQSVVVVSAKKDTVITDDNSDAAVMLFQAERAEKQCEVIRLPIPEWRFVERKMECDNALDITTVIKHHPPSFQGHLTPVSVQLKKSIAWSNVYGLAMSPSEKLDHLIVGKTILGTIGYLFCTPALIYYGAQAGGFTNEAIFWSAFIEISGSMCLIVPIVHFWRKFGCRLIGIALLALGYFVMHTGIATHTEGKISSNIVNSADIRTLEKQEKQLKSKIEPILATVNGLDPVEYRTQRLKLLSGIEEDNKRLLEVQDKLIEARKAKRTDASNQIVESWSMVEWLRRIALNLVNYMAGHTMLAGIPAVVLFYRRKRPDR
jgi:hypothetical protein